MIYQRPHRYSLQLLVPGSMLPTKRSEIHNPLQTFNSEQFRDAKRTTIKLSTGKACPFFCRF